MPLTATIVKASLQGLRFPLTAVERVTHSDPMTWPPAVAYEIFEAETKRMLGSLLRDDALVREGTLQRAKVQELAESERLAVKAEQTREAADAQLEERKESAEQTRERIEVQARQRAQQLASEKAEKEHKVREDARQREEAAVKAAQAREKVVSVQERQAQRTRIAEESAALAKRSQALAANRKAQSVDEALKAKKAQRQS